MMVVGDSEVRSETDYHELRGGHEDDTSIGVQDDGDDAGGFDYSYTEYNHKLYESQNDSSRCDKNLRLPSHATNDAEASSSRFDALEDIDEVKGDAPAEKSPPRFGYQTYPLRRSAEAVKAYRVKNGGHADDRLAADPNGRHHGDRRHPPRHLSKRQMKFMTNAESRPSWSLIDELNFVARTPVYKPALSVESSVRLDGLSGPGGGLGIPLLLGESAHAAAAAAARGEAHLPPRKKLSNSEAVWTIVNIFVGLGMLSKPYSVAQGGWVSLGGLTVLCLWGAASGLIMIRCFQLVPGNRVTYPQLGEAAMGVFGRRLVQAIIIMEFMGATLIVMIFMWKNFSFLFPSVPQEWVAMSLTALSIPSVWLLNFGELSFISLLGVLSNAAIMVALVGMIAAEPGEVRAEKYDSYTDLEGLSVSMGIYTIALAGHAALPSVYADIEDKSAIFSVVAISFAFMWAIYCVTAAAGYLYHGRDSHVLVTEDIMLTKPGWVFECVTMMVLAKSYCSVSPIVSILNEIPEAGLGIRNPWVRRITRTLSLVVLAFLAYLCQDHLGLVEALTGSAFTMASSFILPPLFLVLLSHKQAGRPAAAIGSQQPDILDSARKWADQLTGWDRAYYWFLALMGFVVGVVFTYGDCLEVVKVYSTPASAEEVVAVSSTMLAEHEAIGSAYNDPAAQAAEALMALNNTFAGRPADMDY